MSRFSELIPAWLRRVQDARKGLLAPTKIKTVDGDNAVVKSVSPLQAPRPFRPKPPATDDFSSNM